MVLPGGLPLGENLMVALASLRKIVAAQVDTSAIEFDEALPTGFVQTKRGGLFWKNLLHWRDLHRSGG